MSVTSLIVTYNHARYIRRAIDGALAQETDCPHEILISEDCSTDGTREIVEAYRRQHPGRIRLLLSGENIRSNEVVARGFREARGDYIALLDGDDYWTEKHKLQRQVDFLDAHPDCAMCFHNARVESEDGDSWNWTPETQPAISTLDDILCGNFIATCSTLYRRGVVDIPAWYRDFFPITDWPLHILHAQKGDIGYLDEVMGVYRYHAGGLFSQGSEDRKHEEILDFYRRITGCLDDPMSPRVRRGMFRYFIEWAEEYRSRGDFERAKRCLAHAREARPYARLRDLRRFAANQLRVLTVS